MEVDRWRHSRNAIHEVIKIDAHYISSKPARVSNLRDSDISWRGLLRAYAVASRQLRRSDVVD